MADADGHQAAQCEAPSAPPSAPPTLGASADPLSTMFRQHYRLLVGYLTARLQSEHEARDVAQEAFLRLLQTKAPDGPGVLRAYLFKIATNVAIDRLRHRQVRRRAEAQAQLFTETTARGDADDPAQQWLAREGVGQLLGYLQELPEACRRVIDLHRLQGFGQHEVAIRLGFSERMVRRYLTYTMVYCHLRLEGLAAAQVREIVTL